MAVPLRFDPGSSCHRILLNVGKVTDHQQPPEARVIKDSLRAVAFLAVGSLIGLLECASGHGSVSDPVSRVYRIFQENPETPGSEASATAIATAEGPISPMNAEQVPRIRH